MLNFYSIFTGLLTRVICVFFLFFICYCYENTWSINKKRVETLWARDLLLTQSIAEQGFQLSHWALQLQRMLSALSSFQERCVGPAGNTAHTYTLTPLKQARTVSNTAFVLKEGGKREGESWSVGGWKAVVHLATQGSVGQPATGGFTSRNFSTPWHSL